MRGREFNKRIEIWQSVMIAHLYREVVGKINYNQWE